MIEHRYGWDDSENPVQSPQDETPHLAVQAGLASASAVSAQPAAQQDGEPSGAVD